MFKKRIKVHIPKKNKCVKCDGKAILHDNKEYYISLENVCVVTYKCACGNEFIIKQNVKFI